MISGSSALTELCSHIQEHTVLIAFASASEAMMKCVPLSKIAVVAFSPGRGFAAALPMLTPVKFTDQYFCTAA